jgi:hypothetical protein
MFHRNRAFWLYSALNAIGAVAWVIVIWESQKEIVLFPTSTPTLAERSLGHAPGVLFPLILIGTIVVFWLDWRSGERWFRSESAYIGASRAFLIVSSFFAMLGVFFAILFSV